jgi:hypothetical protein
VVVAVGGEARTDLVPAVVTSLCHNRQQPAPAPVHSAAVAGTGATLLASTPDSLDTRTAGVHQGGSSSCGGGVSSDGIGGVQENGQGSMGVPAAAAAANNGAGATPPATVVAADAVIPAAMEEQNQPAHTHAGPPAMNPRAAAALTAVLLRHSAAMAVTQRDARAADESPPRKFGAGSAASAHTNSAATGLAAAHAAAMVAMSTMPPWNADPMMLMKLAFSPKMAANKMDVNEDNAVDSVGGSGGDGQFNAAVEAVASAARLVQPHVL